MMMNGNSVNVVQLSDSHAYFDLHQEMFRPGGDAVYRLAGGYMPALPTVDVVEGFVPYSRL